MSQMGLSEKKGINIAVFGWLGLPIVGWQGRKGPSSWKAFVAPSASLWQKPCSIRWWRGPTSWGWRGSPTLGRVSSRFFAQAGHETTYSMNHQWCPRVRPLRKTPLRPLSTHLGGLSRGLSLGHHWQCILYASSENMYFFTTSCHHLLRSQNFDIVIFQN